MALRRRRRRLRRRLRMEILIGRGFCKGRPCHRHAIEIKSAAAIPRKSKGLSVRRKGGVKSSRSDVGDLLYLKGLQVVPEEVGHSGAVRIKINPAAVL